MSDWTRARRACTGALVTAPTAPASPVWLPPLTESTATTSSRGIESNASVSVLPREDPDAIARPAPILPDAGLLGVLGAWVIIAAPLETRSTCPPLGPTA